METLVHTEDGRLELATPPDITTPGTRVVKIETSFGAMKVGSLGTVAAPGNAYCKNQYARVLHVIPDAAPNMCYHLMKTRVEIVNDD